MHPQRQLYALAGAMSVEAAELLKTVHRLVGQPGDVSDIPPRRRGLLSAAARTYGAIAACNALTGRVLLMERDAACCRLGEVYSPHLPIIGATALEESEPSTWRGTVRASAAALAELAASRDAWRSTTEEGEAALQGVEALMRYVDEVASVLEAVDPGRTG